MVCIVDDDPVVVCLIFSIKKQGLLQLILNMMQVLLSNGLDQKNRESFNYFCLILLI